MREVTNAFACSKRILLFEKGLFAVAFGFKSAKAAESYGRACRNRHFASGYGAGLWKKGENCCTEGLVRGAQGLRYCWALHSWYQCSFHY